MSETGFVDVTTRIAGAHSIGVPNLGTFALGAGPTIAADGTVLLATHEGKLIALHPDGTPSWAAEAAANAGERFTASPVVDSHGAVFVVGTRSAAIRDHRTNETYNTSFATIRKFIKGGSDAGSTAFPEVRAGAHPGMYGPRAIGKPSLWRSGPFDEALMVPVMYSTIGGYELHILACSTNAGLILGDVTVAEWNGGDVVGDDANFPFEHGSAGMDHAFPGLTVFTHPQGIEPYITIVNPFQNEIVGYTFCVGSTCAHSGFTQHFRTQHAPAVLCSPPTTLPDLHTAAGTDRGVVFSGPAAAAAPVEGLPGVCGKPAIAVDGRAIVATSAGLVVALENRAIVSRLDLTAWTAVGAATSRNHVFVSCDTGFHTLDADARTQLLRFPWVGSGNLPPAIGPEGHVYAMASNALFVFPPPLHVRPLPVDASAVVRDNP